MYYLMFEGRCGRLEYLLLHLVIVLIYVIGFGILEFFDDGDILMATGILILVLNVILHWSTVARRTRDLGMSAYWCLLSLIPYLGFVWVLLLAILPSYKIGHQK